MVNASNGFGSIKQFASIEAIFNSTFEIFYIIEIDARERNKYSLKQKTKQTFFWLLIVI